MFTFNVKYFKCIALYYILFLGFQIILYSITFCNYKQIQHKTYNDCNEHLKDHIINF